MLLRALHWFDGASEGFCAWSLVDSVSPAVCPGEDSAHRGLFTNRPSFATLHVPLPS